MAGPFSNLEDRFKEIEDDGRRPGGNPPTAPPTEQTAFIEIKPLPVIKPPNSRVASKITFVIHPPPIIQYRWIIKIILLVVQHLQVN